MTGEPDKKKPSFRERLRESFNGVSKREWMGVIKYTLEDLRRPKEIALLVGCTFVPGGWIGYGIYRVAKFKRRRAANDNKNKPPGGPAPKP
jgi:hypothetical protein